jgi:uncharacterized protein
MNFMEILKHPWPWYISGPLIGLMVPLLLFFDNRQFGVSSTFRDFCSYLGFSKISYFKYNLKDHQWRDIFVLGIFVGAYLCTMFLTEKSQVNISAQTVKDLKLLGINNFDGLVPSEIFNWHSVLTLRGFVFMIVGGFFVGFGTRYADGCTSGHAIMGLSLLSPASLIAVLGFFTGGLFSTYFLLPIFLK